jgi:hypothetical protein
MPEEYFNLISSPDLQLNSRFAYLASGRCNYNNTDCWTHPGTYVDQLGFMFPGLNIKAVAGTHDDGMMVFVNEKRLHIGATDSIHSIIAHHHGSSNSSRVTISYVDSSHLVVSADLFTIYATNSDMFFNFGVTLHSTSLLTSGAAKHHIKSTDDQHKYPAYPLHGLLGTQTENRTVRGGTKGTAHSQMQIQMQRDVQRFALLLRVVLCGVVLFWLSYLFVSFSLLVFLSYLFCFVCVGQTWKNARYAHGAFFAGSVDDYMLLDSKLFSSKFVFNQYKH